ncbi:hypothetical protein B5S31_g2275 [[Candida] boidinii]|nr:hypothetical protein B5S31_g2275 [[Candida] boidinii]
MSLTNTSLLLNIRECNTVFNNNLENGPYKKSSNKFGFNPKLTISENLSQLAVLLLNDSDTINVAFAFKPVLVNLVSELISNQDLETVFLKKFDLQQNTVFGSHNLNSIAKIVQVFDEYQTELQTILLAFYRLIKKDRQRFHNFVYPKVLYDIYSDETDKFTSTNKFLSREILAIYLQLSDEITQTIRNTFTDCKSTYEGDSNIDYKFLPVLESKRLSLISSMQQSKPTLEKTKYTIEINYKDLAPGVSIIGGILVSNLSSFNQNETNEKLDLDTSDYVAITKSDKILEQMAMCLKDSNPVLLAGRAGSGKTFLINHAAKVLHMDSNSIIKIHLNQQTDSKMLLGTYTSGSTPGTFEWKNGVLTTAVKEGRWVLIEDIDKAPNEVLSILLSLLENRQLTIPSRGEVIQAANGFQLLATMRFSNDSSHSKKQRIPDLIGLRLWNVIQLEDFNSSELKTILNNKFPLLENFNSLFIKCFFEIQEVFESRKLVSMNKGSQPRVPTIRDLMKFCNRCNQLFQNAGIQSTDDLIQDEVYDYIFQEAVDCFASSVVDSDAINALVQIIGSSLEIPTSRVNFYLEQGLPQFDDMGDYIKIGRSILQKRIVASINPKSRFAPLNTTSFAKTNHSLRLMEKIGVGISICEPLLLVGETGTGKTTIVQQMAKLLNKNLTVINLSQQTETGDLLGGFKPVNAKSMALPIQEKFEDLFFRSFKQEKNVEFLKLLSKYFNKSQWKSVIKIWKKAIKMARDTYEKKKLSLTNEDSTKKRKINSANINILLGEWTELEGIISEFEKQEVSMENFFVFKFIEGSLVNAVKNGDWILLDEINLASPETLDSISDLLSDNANDRNILLSEKGDVESIKAHKDFRIFGCMNPATDVGKKDLAPSIRSRFTEIYVHSPDQDKSDLLMIINNYIGKYLTQNLATDVTCDIDVSDLYIEAKRLSETNQIVDGANQKPHFSIRTLTRTLLYVRDIVSIYGLRRSLYEGFCMSFLTLLDAKSEAKLEPIIRKYTIGKSKNANAILCTVPKNPANETDSYVAFQHYWLKRGPHELINRDDYITTSSVTKNLLNLVRATSGRRYPVLIQGPTSSGKTSMINYLASITGHKFVRINNHEHTDLQEYLGTYVSDDKGKLVFKEGVLVDALRNGHWIVLDELNLAPTDVLEALNRLLDDNRELFIPETQEIVRPHPDFMLFATQNPPGIYGGRKILSKAFRNRFLELHFDDIPKEELEEILTRRCKIAPTYAKKIVAVYNELSIQRQSIRVFEQKNSFATLRDLFRWAQREAVGYEQLAANGYMLLAERVRRSDEKKLVKQVLENVMRVKLDMQAYYESLEIPELYEVDSEIVWTRAMRRLAVLVLTSMKYNEPLLLVGETGCGKTTVCQIIAKFFQKTLTVVNAHQNTETSDLLGAQRPVRNRSVHQANLVNGLKEVLSKLEIEFPEEATVDNLTSLYDSVKKEKKISEEDDSKMEKLFIEAHVLFEWCDGPLITSLKNGSFFLLDEISLADDSVLERLNSVLEPERSLLLAEKGTGDSFITAEEGFEFLATMNPGGDYGKKELSPALRNRFTEIWVPSMEDFDDVQLIVSSRLLDNVKHLAQPIVKFSHRFALKFGGGSTSNGVISLRDILAWVSFINSASRSGIEPDVCILHGASMVFIDALGTNNTAFLAANEAQLKVLKYELVTKLTELMKKDLKPIYDELVNVSLTKDYLRCGAFQIPRASDVDDCISFNLQAPTTASNAMRVIRAMQVHKPILLEGSPGVGKTSLVSALAEATGNKLTRINLSEQTDLIDLFGSDSPVEGGDAGEFVWRDAPFLRAMQRGEWVLLDEMNLASQSVLEGLNACLDHRGEAYIPELDRSFQSHPDFLVFAAQNPQYQGGGRKGLPKSFVNRFNVVYVETLSSTDLNLIAKHLYPSLETELVAKIISYISKLEDEISIKKLWGSSGSPWEFNLRDTLRWLLLMNSDQYVNQNPKPEDFLDMIVLQRFRSEKDRAKALELYESIFGNVAKQDPYFNIGYDYVQCKGRILKRNPLTQFKSNHSLTSLQCNVDYLSTIFTCIKQAWPILLVGPSNSGKTELINYAAGVIGSKVYTFSMNSDVDSMDILGGYEQADLTRDFSEIISLFKSALIALISENILESDFATIPQSLELHQFLNSQIVSISNISEVAKTINTFISSCNTRGKFNDLISRFEVILAKATAESKVQFQWFDGLLVQAVERGHWLILDNANLCSPSVLDRLNSLLELNGTLVINECMSEDGNPRTIKPHPNFRLFLTSDPKYGELSRAMRNRGVEMYMDSLDVRCSSIDKEVLGMNDASKINDINVGLSQLDIVRSSYIPCRKFYSPYDSQFQQLLTIIDAFSKNIDSVDGFTHWCLNYSSMELASLIPNFVSMIKSSSFFNSSLISFFEYYYSILSDEIYMKSQKDLFSIDKNSKNVLLSESTFAYFQPIFVSFNSYLFEVISNSCDPSLVRSSYRKLDLFYFYKDLEAELSVILTASQTKKATDLNYLEKIVAVNHGRKLKNVNHTEIYRLIEAIGKYIHSEILFLFETNGDITELNDLVFDLTIFWKNFIGSLVTQNESKMRAYLEILRQMIELNGTNNDDFRKIQKFLASFTDPVSNKSMSLIWSNSKTLYPINEQSWSNKEILNDLAEELDDLCIKQFPENMNIVIELRKIMITLLTDCTKESSQEEFESVCKLLQDKFVTLKTISDGFLQKRDHMFQQEFLLVLLFSISSITNSSNDFSEKNFLELSYLSGSSSLSLFNLTFSEKFKPYPKVLENLWTSRKLSIESHVHDLFSDTLITNMFGKQQELFRRPGGKIEESLSDLKLLMNSIIHNSEKIISHQVLLFRKLLVDWIVYSIEINCEKDLDCQWSNIIDSIKMEGTMGSISLEELKCSSNEKFLDIFKSCFMPALEFLKNSEVNKISLGKAWIFASSGFMQLYVPTSPYDPAIVDHIMNDIENSSNEYYDTIHKCMITLRTVAFGDSELSLEDHVFNETRKTTERSLVYRSSQSTDSLFEEWQKFIESFSFVKNVSELLGGSVDIPQFNNFLQNSQRFIDRLEMSYERYSDLNDILIGYVYGMKLGFELLIQGTMENNSDDINSLWPMNSNILTSSQSMTRVFEEVKSFSKDIAVDNSEVEKVYDYILETSIISDDIKSNLSQVSSYGNQTLLAIYYRWSLRKLYEEEKNSMENGVFKFSAPTLDAEEDFKRLFPDSEDLIDSSKSSSDSLGNFDDAYYKIACTYMSLFSSANRDTLLNDMFKKGVEIIPFLKKSNPAPRSTSIREPTVASMICGISSSIDSFSRQQDSEDVDFYGGFDVYETKKAGLLISNLQGAVHDLLKQWPEHATLQHLFMICSEFLNYSVATPVFKLLTKVEQVYHFINEWEKYAHSGVSLNKHFIALSTLIVYWRKLELVSWKQVFRKEEIDVKKSLGKWWFHLFETIILPAANDEYDDESKIVEVLHTINIFLSSTSYGEFAHRIELLKSFVKHIHYLLPQSSIHDSLQNIITFYEQFKPIIEDAIADTKKRLEKQVNEVILLASWKDINVDALKQSSRRSHHSLYKVIRKYRDFINQSITTVIESGLASSVKTRIPRTELKDVSISSVSEHERIIEICGEVKSFKERPQRLKNIHLVVKNMEIYLKRLSSEELPEIYDYAKSLLEDSEQLRKETPKQLTEENKAQCAALKTQKHKLFSDTLRELRRSGLRLQLTTDVQTALSSVTAIMATTPSFSETPMEGTDGYYFRLLDLLPRLRRGVVDCADDIPVASVEKGLAVSENLIFNLTASRETIVRTSKLYESIDSRVESISRISNGYKDNSFELISGANDNYQLIELKFKTLKHFIKWIPYILDFAIVSVQSSNQFSTIKYSSSVFDEAKTFFHSVSVTECSDLFINGDLIQLHDINNFINTFVTKINSWKSNNKNVSFVGNFVIEWVRGFNLNYDVSAINLDGELVQIEELETALKDLLTSIMISIQKIVKLQQETEVPTEEIDSWIVATQRRLQSYAKALYPLSIESRFDKAILSMQKCESQKLNIVSALSAHSLPILNLYQKLVGIVLSKLKKDYVQTSHGAFILSTILFNLAKDGFCSPQKPQEEKQQDNLHEGTGLGDGDGANDNSKDNDDDEDDLEEQAQQPNAEKDDRDDGDEEEEDNAKDIKGDMAGDLEDAPPEDEGEEGEEETEEKEELDEEVDDIDDMDPNAIDEKMWDEEVKEDKKEKESDNMPDNNDEDDNMEGNDENEDDSKKNDKDSNKQNNKPEEDDAQENNENEEEENEENQNDDKENNDEDGDDQDDVGEQEDDVRNDENEKLEDNVQESEVLDLPDDINLDSDKEGDEEDDDKGDQEDDDKFDDPNDEMDIDTNTNDKENEEDDEDAESQNEDPETAATDLADDAEEDKEDEEAEENGQDDGIDENPQDGEGSDEEELMNVDEQPEAEKEDEKEGEDEQNNEGVEGLENGMNNDNNEVDEDASAQQNAGVKSEGADADVEEDQKDIGASGGSAQQEEKEKQEGEQEKSEEQENSADSSRNLAAESLKQLGDSLKEFHRRHQEIRETTDEDVVDQKSGERPDEFQHLEGDNTDQDTQALGAANKDQIQSINDDMAIDDEEEQDIKEESEEQKEETADADVKKEEVEAGEDQEAMEQPEDADFNGQSKSGFMGNQVKGEEENDLFDMKMEIDEDDEDDDELDEHRGDDDIEEIGQETDLEYITYEKAQELWKKSEIATQELTANLCEQLRLILEPTLATKLKGDYKTGKRLNMKRIIPYIASQFRKDKIWMRRNKPSKRQYQIMIAVDDSKSMSEGSAVELAFESITLVSKALTQLESGQLSVVKFGNETEVVHSFEKPFSSDSGIKIFQRFDFQQTRTDIRKLVNESIKLFNEARSISGDSDLWQLQIILSDGVCEDHETIQRLVRKARDEKIMLVFVIIDGVNNNESIVDMSQVNYAPDVNGAMKLQVTKYLDTFPFEFYVVVHDINELPEMLSIILRQYFSGLANA